MTAQLLTVAEAAERLRISRSLLYVELGRRRLKIGNPTRIREEEIDLYVRADEGEELR